jgi:hypothetical protein
MELLEKFPKKITMFQKESYEIIKNFEGFEQHFIFSSFEFTIFSY